jgi:hypothetical protein
MGAGCNGGRDCVGVGKGTGAGASGGWRVAHLLLLGHLLYVDLSLQGYGSMIMTCNRVWQWCGGGLHFTYVSSRPLAFTTMREDWGGCVQGEGGVKELGTGVGGL